MKRKEKKKNKNVKCELERISGTRAPKVQSEFGFQLLWVCVCSFRCIRAYEIRERQKQNAESTGSWKEEKRLSSAFVNGYNCEIKCRLQCDTKSKRVLIWIFVSCIFSFFLFLSGRIFEEARCRERRRRFLFTFFFFFFPLTRVSVVLKTPESVANGLLNLSHVDFLSQISRLNDCFFVWPAANFPLHFCDATRVKNNIRRRRATAKVKKSLRSVWRIQGDAVCHSHATCVRVFAYFNVTRD